MFDKFARVFLLFMLVVAVVPVSTWAGEPLVTATVSNGGQVRLTALALAQGMRLEVLSQTGESLYDSRLRPGNRLEWNVRDQGGRQLADGVYGCVITVEGLNGQTTLRRGIFRVRDGAASFNSAQADQEAAALQSDERLTVLGAEKRSPFTLVSNDGEEGWIESAAGGLSLFAGGLSHDGASVPQVRLTPEGNLGIGVAEPQARLDVAGTIRASEGFQFSDGTVLRIDSGVPVLVTQASGDDEVGNRRGKKSNRVLASGGTVITPLLAGSSPQPLALREDTTYPFNILLNGLANTGGYENSFFGYQAGGNSNTGWQNAFVGTNAGAANSTGNYNAFIGYGAGLRNTGGSSNAFFGLYSGQNNTTGDGNSFFGFNTGASNTTEDNNAFFGTWANGAAGITNSSAFGFRAQVTSSNSIVLGSIAGVNGAQTTAKVGIGTTSPNASLDVIGIYGAPHASIPSNWAERVTGRRGIVRGARGFYDDIWLGPNGYYAELSTYKWDDGTSLPLVFNANGGNVGIGVDNPTQKLHVGGNLRVAGQILYGAPQGDLPDYVFDPGYKLMPVEELATFVEKEKHLPNVPSAQEMKANGLNLGELQMKLLEKIEELTLYTVQQARTNREQQTALESKDAEIAKLNARLEALEQVVKEQKK